jgi:hypothetical protein
MKDGVNRIRPRAPLPLLVAFLAAGCFDLDLPRQVDFGSADCDGGRYDPRAGLCWQDPPMSEDRSWQVAIDTCEELELGGADDWRLPSIEELLTLYENCGVDLETETQGSCDTCGDSETCHALFGGGNGQDDAAPFWSSTACQLSENTAWGMDYGGWAGIHDRGWPLRVRCVRDLALDGGV